MKKVDGCSLLAKLYEHITIHYMHTLSPPIDSFLKRQMWKGYVPRENLMVTGTNKASNTSILTAGNPS